MFVNCPFCHGLIATDPATDQPPERCPRCAAQLRGAAVPPDTADDARSGVAAAIAEFVGGPGTEAGDPAADRAAQPAISIANLLQPEAADAAGAQEPELAAKPQPEPEPERASPEPESGFEPAATVTAVKTETETEPPAQTAPAVQRSHRAAGRPAPSFARRRHADAGSAPAGRRWPMSIAIAALALLLGLQWLLADRARLAADAGWRPLVEHVCTALRCSLPPWREPTAFALLERDVRPHPAAAGALRITASFRNNAAWAQPWPEVVLTLSDIDGRPLGVRAFAAADYLGGEPPSGLIGSGQGAVIRMDVLEPGPGAVGFAFDFR